MSQLPLALANFALELDFMLIDDLMQDVFEYYRGKTFNQIYVEVSQLVK
jgi:hypothetical protein